MKQSHSKEEEALGKWDLGSPLYDSYELVSLAHLIESHLMTLPYLGASERLSFKKICPAVDDHHLVVPAAILVSNINIGMGGKRETKRVRGSSIFSSLGELARRNLWIVGWRLCDRKDKSKKLAAGHCCPWFAKGRISLKP